MFVIAVTFEVDPAHHESFVAAVSINATRSVADEPGCQRFDVCTRAEAPGEIFLYEIYDDKAAFDAHRATPHFADFEAVSADMVQRKTVTAYTLHHAGG